MAQVLNLVFSNNSLAFLKAELCCRLVAPIPTSLLNLTFPAAVFLFLSTSAKYSMVCKLSVNQLTGIQCRPCVDISLPLSLPSDDALKVKVHQMLTEFTIDPHCEFLRLRGHLLLLITPPAYQPWSDFPPFK